MCFEAHRTSAAPRPVEHEFRSLNYEHLLFEIDHVPSSDLLKSDPSVLLLVQCHEEIFKFHNCREELPIFPSH